MSSQDEYLDSLLSDLTKDLESLNLDLSDTDKSDMDALLGSAAGEGEKALSPNSMGEMSEEEILRLLEAGQEGSTADKTAGNEKVTGGEADDVGLMDILNGSDESELQEIHTLLQKAENNENVEEDAVLVNGGQAADRKEKKRLKKEARAAAKKAKKEAAGKRKKKKTAEENEEIISFEQAAAKMEDESQAFDGDAAVHQAVSAASEDALAQMMEGEKKQKPGLFARFAAFLKEEDEDEPTEELQLSDENKTILKEIDKEKKKSRKKGKKNGKSKDIAKADTAGEEEDDKAAKKGKKQKKAPKVKKEVTKLPDEAKLPVKKVAAIFMLCASVGAVIILCSSLLTDFNMKKAGRKAYYEEDYQTCYQNLYGKKLNESEQVMYCKSECILTISRWLREYELFAEEGALTEALDSLIQSVYDYPTLRSYAYDWNAGQEVAAVYKQLVAELSEKYHLTEEQALEIAENPDDIQYTLMVTAIAEGESFGSWNQQEQVTADVLQDRLPEEDELPEVEFVDNNAAQQF